MHSKAPSYPFSNLYAVHATDVFPTTNKIIAGSQPLCRTKDLDNNPLIQIQLPDIRKTIHFSLGSLISPHGIYSWESKKYAILIPLLELASGLITISPYDTIYLGNEKLPGSNLNLVFIRFELHQIQI